MLWMRRHRIRVGSEVRAATEVRCARGALAIFKCVHENEHANVYVSIFASGVQTQRAHERKCTYQEWARERFISRTAPIGRL
mmetsp:Transcript_2783/g.7667  ORF Transcript_2783/g.7667 Transcript_2783/m.7667 type:complete len:82 (-) Transcript_2783:1907-2152(-)